MLSANSAAAAAASITSGVAAGEARSVATALLAAAAGGAAASQAVAAATVQAAQQDVQVRRRARAVRCAHVHCVVCVHQEPQGHGTMMTGSAHNASICPHVAVFLSQLGFYQRLLQLRWWRILASAHAACMCCCAVLLPHRPPPLPWPSPRCWPAAWASSTSLHSRRPRPLPPRAQRAPPKILHSPWARPSPREGPRQLSRMVRHLPG